MAPAALPQVLVYTLYCIRVSTECFMVCFDIPNYSLPRCGAFNVFFVMLSTVNNEGHNVREQYQ
jgi:hypothetical protein